MDFRIYFFISNYAKLYNYILINNIIKIIIYISIFFTSIYYIEILLIEIYSNFRYKYKFLKKIRKIYYIFSFIYIFIFPLEIFTLSFNLGIYETNFLKNCPYLLNKLDYNFHLERRCELYNINNNSRYSYQYICSYDSSKDFLYKDFHKIKPKNLIEEIKPQYVICVPVKSLKSENKIIKQFINIYKNSNNYYCSRTNKPEEYNYACIEDCNNKLKHIYLIIFLVMLIFQGIYLYFYYISINDVNEINNSKLVEETNVNINQSQNTNGKDIYLSNITFFKKKNIK